MRERDDDRRRQSTIDDERSHRERQVDERPRRERQSTVDDERGDRERPSHRSRRRLPATVAAEAGIRRVVELTGHEVQGIVSLEPADDGWVVGVEVVEDRRIPSSTDVLALYEAEIDGEGELQSYSRRSRYARGKSDRGEVG
jgi:hypothetical protein